MKAGQIIETEEMIKTRFLYKCKKFSYDTDESKEKYTMASDETQKLSPFRVRYLTNIQDKLTLRHKWKYRMQKGVTFNIVFVKRYDKVYEVFDESYQSIKQSTYTTSNHSLN